MRICFTSGNETSLFNKKYENKTMSDLFIDLFGKINDNVVIVQLHEDYEYLIHVGSFNMDYQGGENNLGLQCDLVNFQTGVGSLSANCIKVVTNYPHCLGAYTVASVFHPYNKIRKYDNELIKNRKLSFPYRNRTRDSNDVLKRIHKNIEDVVDYLNDYCNFEQYEFSAIMDDGSLTSCLLNGTTPIMNYKTNLAKRYKDFCIFSSEDKYKEAFENATYSKEKAEECRERFLKNDSVFAHVLKMIKSLK